ncbi:3D domain-containing protein [Klebsormidium nitens]|uniref:3D domain-containing protein n=1 Tax=Klebsormidium nitens TaxID=105231 RepID=A0A1Y1ICS3_KLENI|nr:3D domain-containing protein [Klebsormidium nitens]|eukprot:GAQ85878.1 3D domain-containing protein [Klebsormidium nitens]
MSLIKVGVRKRRKGVREPAIIARYWTKKAPASLVGKEYLGTTSIGTYPHAPRPPLFSRESIKRWERIPFRIIFPWRLPPRYGTLAVDKRHYPIGTMMYIPGHGWGKAEDAGQAIQGAHHIDLYKPPHSGAWRWGRPIKRVEVYPPAEWSWRERSIDRWRLPGPIKKICKGVNKVRKFLF